MSLKQIVTTLDFMEAPIVLFSRELDISTTALAGYWSKPSSMDLEPTKWMFHDYPPTDISWWRSTFMDRFSSWNTCTHTCAPSRSLKRTSRWEMWEVTCSRVAITPSIYEFIRCIIIFISQMVDLTSPKFIPQLKSFKIASSNIFIGTLKTISRNIAQLDPLSNFFNKAWEQESREAKWMNRIPSHCHDSMHNKVDTSLTTKIETIL